MLIVGLLQQEWGYSMGFKKKSFPGPVRESPVGLRGRQAIPEPQLHPTPSCRGSALHTPGKSNGCSSFLPCAGGAKSEGKGKKNYYKCSTNYESRGRAFVPASLGFALSLVFPQPGGSRQDWPRLCCLPGDTQAQPSPGNHLGFKYNPKEQVLLSPAPRAGMNPRRKRWSSLCAECGTA